MEESQQTDNGNAAVTAAALTGQLLSNPNVLAAFTQELGSMVGKSSGYIESLPKSVKRRINALKKLQAELFDIESQFYTEIHDLECKYSKLYAPVLNKRQDIINGILEPTDDDCDWEEPEEEEEKEEEDDSEEKQKTVTVNGNLAESNTESNKATATLSSSPTANGAKQPDEVSEEETKGIPEFWLTIFKNVEELAALVQEHDEPVLKHLQDIRVNYLGSDNMGFQIAFAFAPNEYFTNTVLTKEYHLRCKPDEENRLNYEGPEIVKCTGCAIDWKPGKNVTEKIVKQKSKNRNKKSLKKTVKVDSFFNFFSPPKTSVADAAEAEDEEVENQLMLDFDIGRLLQERIVPRAVLYFTGEALEDDDDDEDDDEEGNEQEDGEDYDEGEDPDYVPPEGTKDGPPDCKQQ